MLLCLSSLICKITVIIALTSGVEPSILGPHSAPGTGPVQPPGAPPTVCRRAQASHCCLAAGMSGSGVVLLVSHQRGCTLRRDRLAVPLLRQMPAPKAQHLPLSDGRELASSLACREDQMPSTVP